MPEQNVRRPPQSAARYKMVFGAAGLAGCLGSIILGVSGIGSERRLLDRPRFEASGAAPVVTARVETTPPEVDLYEPRKVQVEIIRIPSDAAALAVAAPTQLLRGTIGETEPSLRGTVSAIEPSEKHSWPELTPADTSLAVVVVPRNEPSVLARAPLPPWTSRRNWRASTPRCPAQGRKASSNTRAKRARARDWA
jgi:hypothetical protein